MADEDDYLSDKFLLEAAPEASSSRATVTYSDRRKEVQRNSQLKNEANRRKTRRQIHEEELREGLSTSLFEKARTEQEQLGTKSKAMSMMEKMGFKLGESLGRKEHLPVSTLATVDEPPTHEPAKPPLSSSSMQPQPSSSSEVKKGQAEQRHRNVPLSIDIWEGKKGVGLGKRAVSPGAVDRIAKAAKLAEETSHEDYRSRARDEFEERRAEGRLRKALSTLLTLDEKADVKFNVLSLDPHNAETIPPKLLDALEEHVAGFQGGATRAGDTETDAQRLKRQMQLDALQPLGHNGPDDDDELPQKKTTEESSRNFSEDEVVSAKEHLELNAQDRLARVTTYLRRQYSYCFWCGSQYDNEQELAEVCPGEDEDLH